MFRKPMAFFVVVICLAAGVSAQRELKYPETRKSDQTDVYFGTKVADPYRWLENNDSKEVADWVEAENKVTFAYLDQIPYRAQLTARLTKLYNYPKIGAPSRRGEWFIFFKERRAAESERLLHTKRPRRNARDAV